MRIAVCTSDMDARHALSRLADDALLRRGVLPELTLFPMLAELMAVMAGARNRFDLVITDARDASALKCLCRAVPVILVGGREDGPAAFDIGVRYFIETPVNREKLDRAIARCLNNRGVAI